MTFALWSDSWGSFFSGNVLGPSSATPPRRGSSFSVLVLVSSYVVRLLRCLFGPFGTIYFCDCLLTLPICIMRNHFLIGNKVISSDMFVHFKVMVAFNMHVKQRHLVRFLFLIYQPGSYSVWGSYILCTVEGAKGVCTSTLTMNISDRVSFTGICLTSGSVTRFGVRCIHAFRHVSVLLPFTMVSFTLGILNGRIHFLFSVMLILKGHGTFFLVCTRCVYRGRTSTHFLMYNELTGTSGSISFHCPFAGNEGSLLIIPVFTTQVHHTFITGISGGISVLVSSIYLGVIGKGRFRISDRPQRNFRGTLVKVCLLVPGLIHGRVTLPTAGFTPAIRGNCHYPTVELKDSADIASYSGFITGFHGSFSGQERRVHRERVSAMTRSVRKLSRVHTSYHCPVSVRFIRDILFIPLGRDVKGRMKRGSAFIMFCIKGFKGRASNCTTACKTCCHVRAGFFRVFTMKFYTGPVITGRRRHFLTLYIHSFCGLFSHFNCRFTSGFRGITHLFIKGSREVTVRAILRSVLTHRLVTMLLFGLVRIYETYPGYVTGPVRMLFLTLLIRGRNGLVRRDDGACCINFKIFITPLHRGFFCMFYHVKMNEIMRGLLFTHPVIHRVIMGLGKIPGSLYRGIRNMFIVLFHIFGSGGTLFFILFGNGSFLTHHSIGGLPANGLYPVYLSLIFRGTIRQISFRNHAHDSCSVTRWGHSVHFFKVLSPPLIIAAGSGMNNVRLFYRFTYILKGCHAITVASNIYAPWFYCSFHSLSGLFVNEGNCS